jgi:peptidoglycan/xylan/chitin deacetylase (PgdA/CDA1 family)
MKGIWRRSSDRPRWRIEALVGVLMIPLSVLPIYLYMAHTADGYLMYLHGRYQLLPPRTPPLSDEVATLARAQLPRQIVGVPVLVYHGIGKPRQPHGLDGPYVVSRGNFAEQMRALRAAGYSAITVAELVAYLRGSTPTPATPARKPILITFDDGRTDAMLQADKVLRDTGLRAAMFVIGRSASTPSFAFESWDDLERHAASGRWELANQSDSLHDVFDDVKGRLPVSALVHPAPGESPSDFGSRIAADLDRAQKQLRAHGAAPIAFAYPFGDWGQHMSPRIQRVVGDVVRSRFLLAFDQDRQSGWRFAIPGDDPLRISRLRVLNWSGAELLERLDQAATLTTTTYRDRGLDVSITQDEVGAITATQRCGSPQASPVSAEPDTQSRVVALTFDGGPSAYTPQIVDILELHNAHATFFVEGRNVRGRSPQLTRIAATGNEIGNGAWSSTRALRSSPTRLRHDLLRTSKAIAAATSVHPCVTRPPEQETAERHAAVARPLGMTTVLWSQDPRDLTLRSPALIAQRVLRDMRPGGVIRLHDGGADRWATVQALPEILDRLGARGYRVVTVSDLLARHSRSRTIAGSSSP